MTLSDVPGLAQQVSTASKDIDQLRLKVRNRRKRYLDMHPDYLTSGDLELADPLLYDRLIRRFQSAADREAEGRRKGYSGILEADILRSEAKIDALAHPDPHIALTYHRGKDGEVIAEDLDEVPQSKEEGLQMWRDQMIWRFLRGGDTDFDYQQVDNNEAYDYSVEGNRDEEDRYFDAESPSTAAEHDQNLQGETGIQDF